MEKGHVNLENDRSSWQIKYLGKKILTQYTSLHVYVPEFYFLRMQGSKLLGFRMSGTPKMVKETRFLDQGFQLETHELSGKLTTLNLGFVTGNPKLLGKSKY